MSAATNPVAAPEGLRWATGGGSPIGGCNGIHLAPEDERGTLCGAYGPANVSTVVAGDRICGSCARVAAARGVTVAHRLPDRPSWIVSAVIAAVFAVLALSACGGSSPVYSADATAQCLAPLATVDRAGADFIAGGTGGYLVTIDGHLVNIAFGGTRSQGDEIRKAYAAVGSSPDEPVYQIGNVVLVWDGVPPSADKAAVDACLR